MKDLLDKIVYGSSPFTSYGLPIEEPRPIVNDKTVCNHGKKLEMGDLIELTTSIPHMSLTEYMKEISRLFGKEDEFQNETGHMLGKNSQVATVTSFLYNWPNVFGVK